MAERLKHDTSDHAKLEFGELVERQPLDMTTAGIEALAGVEVVLKAVKAARAAAVGKEQIGIDVVELFISGQLLDDPYFPVVCMDESSKQLVGEVAAPIPMAPGHGQIIDHEYVRNGVAEIFVEVEPLAGKRHVEFTELRTRKDWANFIKGMLDERYPNAIKVRLLMDNLNTHDVASFYETFDPAEAKRLAGRIEIHHTPKHGSWLNIAEIQLGALQSQCMNRRIPNREFLQKEISAWESERNTRGAPIHWRFNNENARIKLTRLYPKL